MVGMRDIMTNSSIRQTKELYMNLLTSNNTVLDSESENQKCFFIFPIVAPIKVPIENQKTITKVMLNKMLSAIEGKLFSKVSSKTIAGIIAQKKKLIFPVMKYCKINTMIIKRGMISIPAFKKYGIFFNFIILPSREFHLTLEMVQNQKL